MNKIGSLHYSDWDLSHIPEILQEIYLQKIYHPYLTGTDGIFLDLGLNIGLWSLFASKYAKQIYAFEPAKEIYDIALLNLKDNGITNVKAFQKAISVTDGKATFYHSSNTTCNSLLQAINDNKITEEVETITLETLVKQEKIEHINFIKCDIEGFEDKLLCSDSFRAIAPITDTIVYEWHQWSNSNPNIINAGLKDMGYRAFRRLPVEAYVFACTK
jgi:FkbM family methyltransferase